MKIFARKLIDIHAHYPYNVLVHVYVYSHEVYSYFKLHVYSYVYTSEASYIEGYGRQTKGVGQQFFRRRYTYVYVYVYLTADCNANFDSAQRAAFVCSSRE